MYAIGIDIGGSSAKVAMVDSKGKILFRHEVIWKSMEKVDNLIAPLVTTVKSIEKKAQRDKKDIAGIGLASPGYLNEDRSEIIFAANLPALNGFPLVSTLEQRTGKKVILDTDVNMGGMAEALLGAGKKFKRVMYVNIGTGVGASLVVDRVIVRHTRHGIGHLGHITLQPNGEKCGCGNKGCIETVVSIRGIQRVAKEVLQCFPDSIVNRHVRKEHELTPFLIYKMAQENKDPAAKEIFKYVGKWLGYSLYNYCVIYVPEVIVIGGGIADAGSLLIKPAQKVLDQQVKSKLFENVKVRKSHFGKDAGVIGAALNFMRVNG